MKKEFKDGGNNTWKVLWEGLSEVMHTRQQPLEVQGKHKIDSSSIVLQITRKMASFPSIINRWKPDKTPVIYNEYNAHLVPPLHPYRQDLLGWWVSKFRKEQPWAQGAHVLLPLTIASRKQQYSPTFRCFLLTDFISQGSKFLNF